MVKTFWHQPVTRAYLPCYFINPIAPADWIIFKVRFYNRHYCIEYFIFTGVFTARMVREGSRIRLYFIDICFAFIWAVGQWVYRILYHTGNIALE